jgi:hypothetical protein
MQNSISELEHLLSEWAMAWSASDVEKLLSLFTEDVYYEDVTFGAVNTGKEALRNFAVAALEDGGVFDWIGRANEKEFVGFFTSAHYTGTFNLSRPK